MNWFRIFAKPTRIYYVIRGKCTLEPYSNGGPSMIVPSNSRGNPSDVPRRSVAARFLGAEILFSGDALRHARPNQPATQSCVIEIV